MTKPHLVPVAVLVTVLLAYGGLELYKRVSFEPTNQTNVVESPPPGENNASPEETPNVTVVAENLTIPWEVAFLPNGDLLVTERTGTLLKIGADRTRIPIEGVEHRGEGGLLGLALHPDFSKNNWIYLYLTTRAGDRLINRVERYRLDGNGLHEKTTIIDNIPGASFHDGGRLKFGPATAEVTAGRPDYYLYITTGDAGDENSAQDTSSLAGKILRLRDDGTVPADNPFGNAVYSYGHRNPQGITWDDDGNLWSTEHGRSGLFSGLDELNRIEKGRNYGWPVIQGDELRRDMEPPVINSGPDITWAPASAQYLPATRDSSGQAGLKAGIFFGGLRGESLYRAEVEDGVVVGLKAYFHREFGRIRTVREGPDGMLYITTSNRDGRGSPREGDDKIIRLNPAQFR